MINIFAILSGTDIIRAEKVDYAIFVVESSILVILFLLIVILNIISVTTLFKSQSAQTETSQTKRRATVTVAIISAIYCITNIAYIVLEKGILTVGFAFSIELSWSIPYEWKNVPSLCGASHAQQKKFASVFR